ncbi:MAG: hypothetical protein V2B18_11825 [Pseudomonadota bacterium]
MQSSLLPSPTMLAVRALDRSYHQRLKADEDRLETSCQVRDQTMTGSWFAHVGLPQAGPK